MNSQKIYIVLLSIVCILLGCQIQTARPTSDKKSSAVSSAQIDPKYAIAQDRTEFDKLRESVPADVKIKNDEKSLMLSLFQNENKSPQDIREKFNDLLRKKRELFNKDMNKSRDVFNKNERKQREEFSKQLEKERKEFLAKKSDAKERADFFNEQDQKRREFSADQKDKRDEFEADTREKRKNFEDYTKEKSDEFNAEIKTYMQKINDKKNEFKNNESR